MTVSMQPLTNAPMHQCYHGHRSALALRGDVSTRVYRLGSRFGFLDPEGMTSILAIGRATRQHYLAHVPSGPRYLG